MKIYVVKHEHHTESSESDYCENVSAHLSLEKAEKSLREVRNEILKEWERFGGLGETKKIDKDFAGQFHIYDEKGASFDEVIINELTIKD